MDGSKSPDMGRPSEKEVSNSAEISGTASSGLETVSSSTNPNTKPGTVSRRGFIAGAAAFAATLFGKSTEAQAAPARQNDEHDNNPIIVDPLQTRPVSPKPAEGVPADMVDLNNTYAMKAPASDEDGGSSDSGGTDTHDEPKPLYVDGNAKGPNGEDILPMVPDKNDGIIMAKESGDNMDNGGSSDSGEPKPLYVDGNAKGPNGEDILPMMPRRETETIMAKVDPNSVIDGTLPLPPTETPPVTPMMQPDRSKYEVAIADPTKGGPLPDKPAEIVTPMMPRKDDGISKA